MKKLSLALLMLVSSLNVQAEGLSIIGANAITFSGYDGEPLDYTGARDSGFTGSINALFDGNLQAVYLGQNSDDKNRFRFEAGNALNEVNNPGDFISTEINAGIVNFRFRDITTGDVFRNGLSTSFVIMSGFIPSDILGTDYGPFDYILGLNDSGSSDGDYDDFVVGLRFLPVSEVPVPAALPLMASALGLFGLSRRRQLKAK